MKKWKGQTIQELKRERKLSGLVCILLIIVSGAFYISYLFLLDVSGVILGCLLSSASAFIFFFAFGAQMELRLREYVVR